MNLFINPKREFDIQLLVFLRIIFWKQYRDRFTSIVIQLNDTYKGGELEIKNIKEELVPIENKIGTLYIFNSRLLHRVVPVVEGVRYSLVNWVSLVKTDSKKQNLIYN